MMLKIADKHWVNPDAVSAAWVTTDGETGEELLMVRAGTGLAALKLKDVQVAGHENFFVVIEAIKSAQVR